MKPELRFKVWRHAGPRNDAPNGVYMLAYEVSERDGIVVDVWEIAPYVWLIVSWREGGPLICVERGLSGVIAHSIHWEDVGAIPNMSETWDIPF